MADTLFISTPSQSLQEKSSHQQQIKKIVHSLTKAGIPVFPCLSSNNPDVDKKPATPNGFKDASLDVNQFDWDSNLLIGVSTGIISDVLDIDYQHPEAVEWAEQHQDKIPDTRIHLTRSGGFHVFFRADPRVSCTGSRIAKKIDTRGKGGYIIWWAGLGFPVWNPTIIAPWPESIIALIPKHEETVTEQTEHSPANYFDILAALDAIDSNCDEQTWVQILAGLKNELGNGGFALARDWSSTSRDKYPGDARFVRRWTSLALRKFTIATVFHYAYQANPNWKYDFTDKQFKKEKNNGIIRRF